MAGVPSGRGCEACRKQKKKCDELKPACSRCKRLRIDCKGSGQQRFKFKDQTLAFRSNKDQASQSPSSSGTEMTRSPSNETTVLVSAFISTLEVKHPGYDLSCYGWFLQDIPKRLGTNDALDAAVGAISAAYSSIYTRQRSVETFSRYGHALRTLRVCLNDHKKSHSVDTLCAIYLIMVCQGFIGRRDDQETRHGEGMALILNTIGSRETQGSFEGSMLFTLCLPALIESTYNPKVQLGPWIEKLLVKTYGPPTPDPRDEFSPHKLAVHSIADMPRFIRDPELHYVDMQYTYQLIQAEYPKLQQRVAKLEDEVSSTKTPTLPFMKLQHAHQATYGIIMTAALILNGMLRAFEPYNYALVEDSILFTNEVLALAEKAARYRPLGAGYIPLCLMAAWATLDDTSKRAEVEMMLAVYQTDFRQNKFEQLRLKVSGQTLDDALMCLMASNAGVGEQIDAMETGGLCSIV
ncbi:hypothetical protein NA57DRAFT_67772 [Rhizodiscina lignyota]|uniref:Zn(2)-C6 fungal-type domain-containing protein n=1 Tax=Rhizodiscina lignyota TaxID=1504668 RepID=A0A9P4IAS1_9PEZI|nr:hypothetical protein NA57DRAFT_67772 [Rhizodiscina lignyota]